MSKIIPNKGKFPNRKAYKTSTRLSQLKQKYTT